MATSKPVEERLPDLEDGELAEVMGLKVVEKTTRPPAHYTEASLLEDMMSAGKFIENDPALRKALKVVSGLGTAATRAATIEGLKNDRYLEKSGKSITATPKGIALIQWLEGIAPELTDVAVTARWEAELAVVAVTGGGAAFEANVVEMVKTLIARLKTAPAMSLAPPSTTSPKETSRMSETTGERSSAPTPKMLEYAGNIAAKMGVLLPEAAATGFEACKEFIDANKEAAMRPSEKQLKFATSIAERKGLSIPAEVLANGKELSAWIDASK